ncbi:BatD family protein [Persicobacter psychrovividus]|uniref:Oxygen tolerance protein BatD n=1 Tax=Persicobacter psychrovividus TaxID=387638 RepID=A0ABM7VBA5_9BACT|nr:hypothetical protein PEPS_04810 [Persicobacter psychrovividus]
MERNWKLNHVLFVLALLLLPLYTFAQNEKVSLELGSSSVAKNQMFTITIKVENGRMKSHTNFPQIDGFVMQGTSSSSSTNYINGQMSSSESLIQNYAPTKEGKFRLPPFKMEVNGQTLSSSGTTITVGPARQRRRSRGFDPFGSDPFDDFFGRRNTQPQEFVDVKDDAFFALTTSKNQIYVGEGVNVNLAFYVAANNQAPMDFYQLPEQVQEMVKKIKPASCWEENFNIDRINGVPVTINGKSYTQYRMYQATYFPLNAGELKFPSLSLKMIKYKVAKQQTFFGNNKKEDYKTFKSPAKTVKVIELPEHPLKDKVSVGRFRLSEKLSRDKLDAGKSFEYSFTVNGQGNIASINKPILVKTKDIEFYPPNIRQNINRNNNRISGSKTFTYYGIPREPGTYKLSDFFYWVYFDPSKQAYDTLRPRKTITVTGQSQKFVTIESNNLGEFYNRIGKDDNELEALEPVNYWQWIGNILIVLAVTGTAVLLIRKN